MDNTRTSLEISVAPMMDWTDRHCRYFHRLLAPHVRLYTEMVTTGALLHGDRERFLRFNPSEHPVALQLGGSDPKDLAFCAEAGQAEGYDEINLNCGCPSDRVQKGKIGACLMGEPALVQACVKSMVDAVDIPVTVKCRIGIDEQDDFEFLDRFVGMSADAGCKTFIIHARKAWLNGLSPKENREIPPLMYDRAAAIKEKYPHLRIILNGGITSIEEIIKFTSSPTSEAAGRTQSGDPAQDSSQRDANFSFDGVMIGREAYQNPWFLTEIERTFFKAHFPLAEEDLAEGCVEKPSRETIALKMHAYAREQRQLYGTPIKSITRHILGLYHGQPRGKIWRRTLSTLPYVDGADESIILQALEIMEGDKKLAA